jgi:hypothetical protein
MTQLTLNHGAESTLSGHISETRLLDNKRPDIV